MFNIMITFCQRLKSSLYNNWTLLLLWIWCQSKSRNTEVIYWEGKPCAGETSIMGNVTTSEYIGRLRSLNLAHYFLSHYNWVLSECCLWLRLLLIDRVSLQARGWYLGASLDGLCIPCLSHNFINPLIKKAKNHHHPFILYSGSFLPYIIDWTIFFRVKTSG